MTQLAAEAVPPPPGFVRRNRVAVTAVLAVLGVGTVLSVAVVVWFLAVYAGHDRPELIDDPVVDEAASAACAVMTDAVRTAAPSAGDPPAAVAAAVRAQDEAVLSMVATVTDLGDDRLDGDHPSRSWLADWVALVEVRETQADLVAAGSPAPFEVPMTDDGYPVTTRMSEAVTACEVPAELTASWP